LFKRSLSGGRMSKTYRWYLRHNESSRRDNTLLNPSLGISRSKSCNSWSPECDNNLEDNWVDDEVKKCDGFRGGRGRPPGKNTKYFTDFSGIWDEASLTGSRYSSSNKLDTPRSRRSQISDRSFSPVSDSESFDVHRLKDLRGSEKASTPRSAINISDFGNAKDHHVGTASTPPKHQLWRQPPTSLVLPSYKKLQTPPSQCSETYNLTTTSTTSETLIMPQTPTAATHKECPIDEISIVSSASVTSERTAGHVNRKNSQSKGRSLEECVYEHTVDLSKPLKTRSLPLGNLSKVKTEELPKEGRKLKCCTLEDIIQRINHPFRSDARSKRILFICWRAFCTRSELLIALEKFYEDPKLPTDFHDWDASKRPNATVQAKRLMRIKLLNLVRYWLREYFYDFDNGDLQHIQNWTNRILATGDGTNAKCVKSILREMSLIRSGKRHRISSKILRCDYPDTLYNKHKTPETIFDVRSEEIARQMCLIDHEVFSAIRPHEFLGQSWKKKNRYIEAPNLSRFIQHFNEVSSWCQAMILYEKNLRRRSYVLGRLLKICFYLNRLENLNSFCAIMCGIRANPIFRLKKTFACLKPKHAKRLRDFQELLRTDKNHKNLRKRMANLVEPGIPHLGLLFQDILSIENASENSKTEKINLSKYSLFNDLIEGCLQYQGYPFRFQPLEKVQAELRRCCHKIPNDFLYKLSLIHEPREN